MSLKENARRLKVYLPALFLAIKKAETPWTAKIVAGMAVAYALSPIDLIPDFIPGLGYLDDIIIVPMLIALAIKLIPQEIMDGCLKEAEGMWSEGKPGKWLYALPIIGFWIAVIGLAGWKLYGIYHGGSL